VTCGADVRREQPVVLTCLGMPLDAHAEPPRRQLDPLDHAVLRPRRDEQPLRDSAEGLVVVARMWQKVRTNSRLPARAGWTLHRDDCFHITHLNGRAMPAPANPYPDTVACSMCRPGDPHRYVYTTAPDGSVTGTCTYCAIVVTGKNHKTANSCIARAHEQAAAVAELAAAMATGTVTRTLTRRHTGGWTLHQVPCFIIDRSLRVRPAPATLPADTVSCQFCKPSGAPPAPELSRTGHHRTRTHGDDGAVQITCSCGMDSGMRCTDNAARAVMVRMHRAAENRAAT